MTLAPVKPVVLVTLGNYLPGYKAGGIIRTVTNTVDHLCDEFEFRILTSDRDLGDDRAYPGVELNQWQQVGNALVYYVPPTGHTMRNLAAIVKSVPTNVLYLNSFFDPFTVKLLACVRAGTIPPKRLIVAPRGEFAWASLRQKYPKKLGFILAARSIGLYRHVVWHASSEFEGHDIMKVMKVDRAAIHVAFDFALKKPPSTAANDEPPAPAAADGALKLIFLSRVAREKNLDYALRLLRHVRSEVVFDIYGPTADPAYWQECQNLIGQLPTNVVARYRGMVDADRVVQVFSEYDLFLFPTGGEAYGQVIAEALIAGTPVLASRESAWRDLANDRLGWDIDLTQPEAFVEKIEALAATPPQDRLRGRHAVKAGVAKRLADPAIAESHRRLLLGNDR